MREPADPVPARAAPAPPRPRRGRWLLLGAAGLLVLVGLLYAALFGYRFLQSQLGAFAPLVAVLALALLVAILGPILLMRYHAPLETALMRGGRWLWGHVRATGLSDRLAARFPRLARLLQARLARTPTGLTLTLGLLAAGALLWNVLELLVEVVTGSPVVGLDHRVLNLVASLRTPPLDQVMYVVTFLGNTQVIVVLAGVAVFVALLALRWRDALLLVAVLVASELFFGLLKLLVQRPRPLLEDARIIQGSFSFPSGHSTLSATFYGTVAYLLIRATRRDGLKVLLGVTAALLVLAIGVSRIYLGAHYPSDVLAGWAAGALWVVLVIVAEQVWASPQRTPFSRLRRAIIFGSAAVLLVEASVYAATLYRTIPPPPTSAPPALAVIAPDAVAITVAGHLPHYSDGLTGHPQEPVSLILVGTQAQLERAFRAAGWTEARPYGFGVLAGGIVASLTHQADPAGPVTPSFLADEPNALAFSLPVGKTFAERHHIRLWTTSVVTSAGQPLWLATASFDCGFELAPSTFLPTHQIAPDIDTERAFVVTSLQSTGLLTSSQTIQLVPPESGHNFDGDPFHTDGLAVILQFS